MIEAMKESFVKIEGGKFLMGSPLNEPNRVADETQHFVTLSSFYMGVCEITQHQWHQLMQSNPSGFLGDTLPVENISWFDAVEYCNKRSVAEGLKPVYIHDGFDIRWNRELDGYRLPTEAEWEYACRAGTTSTYYSGSSLSTERANFNRSKRKTMPVGSYLPNTWGLRDMYGNVWEWCWDWYDLYKTHDQKANIDPEGPSSGDRKIWRGGSWGSTAQVMRSAFRGYSLPTLRFNYLGFRIVRTVR